MNTHLQTAKTFITSHKKQFTVALGISLGAVIVLVVVLGVYNTTPMKYTYQPIKACELFTPAEAQDLLGDKVISVDSKAPVISDNVSTSKCSYTDSNPVKGSMIVAAVAVRSAVYDKGIAQNKTDFATARSNNTVETVKDLGEDAYFNKANGQLHILNSHKWIIVSYVVGSTPVTDSPGKAIDVARKVLN